MQTNGKLHLGNYVGALKNWVAMQEAYDCFYFAADWHALSSSYDNTGELKENLIDLTVNWLSAGIDPAKSTLFVQSLIPEHAVLHLYLSMITPLPWLERVPSYKEKMEVVTNRDLHTYGFLGYPVLQAADIIIYKANFVPVGIDQLPHLELTREIVRRFHDIYKTKVFVEPEGKLSEAPKLPGLDGRKMSKSYNNAIFLSDTKEEISQKIRNIVTDPARVRKTDPGDPEKCIAYDFHKIFSPAEENALTVKECTTAARGCVDCKKKIAENVFKEIGELLEKRNQWSAKPGEVLEILWDGTEKARAVAKETLGKAEEALSFDLKNLKAKYR